MQSLLRYESLTKGGIDRRPSTATIPDLLEFDDPFSSLDESELRGLDAQYHIEPGREFVYCLHCVAWKQHYVAHEASKFFPCEAINPILVKRIWKNNEYKNITYSLMPGYVFLFSAEVMDSGLFVNLDGALKVLQYAGGGYALTENDEKLARWLLRYDGTIGLSKAIKVGSNTRIIQGPLKDRIGIVKEVNKGRGRAKIELTFNEKSWPVWLDFEYVEGL